MRSFLYALKKKKFIMPLVFTFPSLVSFTSYPLQSLFFMVPARIYHYSELRTLTSEILTFHFLSQLPVSSVSYSVILTSLLAVFIPYSSFDSSISSSTLWTAPPSTIHLGLLFQHVHHLLLSIDSSICLLALLSRLVTLACMNWYLYQFKAPDVN